MKRRCALYMLLAFGIAPLLSFAQPPAKVWRVGFLETTVAERNEANIAAFRKAMQEFGYVEGKHYVMEYRSSDGRNDRFPDLAAELVRLKVDVIVVRGTPAALALQKATSTIPVVVTATDAPLLFADSLARPGRNVTGMTAMNAALQGKRLQLVRELVPGFTRLASVQNMGNAAVVSAQRELETAAQSLGVKVRLMDVRKAEDLGPAIDEAAKQRAQMMVVGMDGLIQSNGPRIVELATRHRIPTMFQARDFVQQGGLISYGVNYPDLYRRSASYVDRIFKGAKAGDLPMEQPTKFDLVVNLKTAKTLGIAIPQTVLLRADEVIE